MLKKMFKRTCTAADQYKISKSQQPSVPEGLWKKCSKCGQPIYGEDVKKHFYTCPKCGGYFRVHAYRRIRMVLDEGSFEEWNREMDFCNPLNFPGYEEKIEAVREKSRLQEAVVTGKGTICGFPVVIGVCDSRFLMGSMGHVVGEKITKALEQAAAEQLPVVIYAASGGARMQEGLVSLMQMAKTSAALKQLHQAGQVFISVLTDPTTGGVTASFAMLGDIILAEPEALIGFAGPRVIQQTIGQKLPEGFQKSEFLLEHGFIDQIVKREEQRDVLGHILAIHSKKAGETDLSVLKDFTEIPFSVRKKSPWETVQLSRRSDRPTALDYIHEMFDGFMELHGDRCFGDDGAIVGGIAFFQGIPVTVMGQQKGRTTKENIKRNFGMPSPEGYRKSLRLMKQAEHFGRPVICFVDTPGAFCGIEAEERGQGEAIARSLFEMSDLKVPVLSIVIGEGGSGGALAMAAGNEVWIMEHAVYSILSPEGFASILWKDSKLASKAAEVMKMTAADLQQMNMAEQVIREEKPASLETLPRLAEDMKVRLSGFLKKYLAMSEEELIRQRYERFRRM